MFLLTTRPSRPRALMLGLKWMFLWFMFWFNNIIRPSGVVRRSAAWGENKKCRPCLYFIWLFDVWFRLFWLIMYFACSKFEFDSSEIRSFVLHYFTNHWHFLYLSLNHPSTVQPSRTLGNFKFNTPPQPFQFILWHIWHTRLTHLANSFLKFFNDKIERIRSKFSSSDSSDPHLFPISPSYLSNFNLAIFKEIHNLIFSYENKQCELDSIPILSFWNCFNELGINLNNILNFSLSEGIFPSSFKQAIVHPQLKKPSLPDDDFNNIRPISNLNFISKIFENVVASRIQSHLLSNLLSSSFQSAYRMLNSIETTLLSIHRDLILVMERGEVTLLILLDLSAAFDSVDHSILHRLRN